ncbi:glycosyltransferase [Aminipila sp.]|uniref:glycosyltransferase n=1 Tax=Aminipila sp. TaxID=2060095 RepID=UPI00289C0B4B|nr:glycosyltransferase [Aminipila sp.]
MLEIAKQYPGDNSQEFISDNSCYTINNTFSKVRENILNWYPFKENASICEVGAGMGAITGLLCDKAKKVTAIEMNALRAEIIKKRNADKTNLTVISEDINYFETEEKYDYVIFIGVLEYAGIFLTEDNPYEKFIINVSKLLKEDGILLFAIENRFGIKYFSGASEDHLQNPFVGIEGYKEKNTAKTFSKAELIEMLNNCGLSYNRFYYVLPDYKFPNIIATDNYIPSYNELQKVPFTYGKNSVLLFNEKDAYKDIIKNETFGFFANSFLVETSKTELERDFVVFVSARGECKKDYKIVTTIDTEGTVRKIPTTKEAEKHIQQILDNTTNLKKRGINVLEYNLNDNILCTPFYNGKKADKVFEESIKTNDFKTICLLVDSLRKSIFKSSDISKSDYNILEESGLYQKQYNYGTILEKGYIDMTFYNAFFENGELTFYDQEWCFDKIPANFILYYAIKCTYNRISEVKYISLENILNYAGIGDEAAVYDKLEEYLWATVLYRQGDIYGEDGYCNVYNSSYTLKNILQEYKDIANSLHEKLKHNENLINKLNVLIKEQEKHINENNQQIEAGKALLYNKESHIELLLESEREFERFKQSRSWRYMSYIWKINGLLIPRGSKRRLVAKIMLKFVKHPPFFLKKISPTRIKKLFYYLRREGAEGVSKRLEDCLSVPSEMKMNITLEAVANHKSFEEYEKLYVNECDNPQVSIVVPVYNQFDYTYNCIKSIINCTEKVTYEIIVADDCSDDMTTRIEEIIFGINVINNETNLQFLKNCNNASKYAKGEYIIFLNNDTQVQQNWLKPLVELIESDKTIGLVGSKLIYPDGRLQEAGGIFWKDGSAWNYGNGSNPNEPEFNYVKEVDYISGASIMLSKRLWDEIGGFDERFAPAYCEDSDLAFEVTKRRYKVVYQPKSVVVHFEGISNGTDISQGQKAYQIINQKKFYEKWRDILECEHSENGEHVFLARDCSFTKKTVLVVDHYIPTFDKDAGSRTVYQYIKLLCSMGYNVKLIGDNFYKNEPYASSFEKMGVEILYGPYYASHWKDWIKENKKYIDFIFLNRPHISIKYIDFVKEHTNAKIIYYGHDLHFLRISREYEITKEERLLKEKQKWRKMELDIMAKSDVVFTLSTDEQAIINKELGEVKAVISPIFYYNEKVLKEEIVLKKREHIIFVGGFSHRPNEDGVLWFVEKIWPIINKQLPNTKFTIIGSNPSQKINDLQNDKIKVTGYISDEELDQYYKQARICVIPLRYGAGVKGKTIEAMQQGVSIVSTSIGTEGLVDIEKYIKPIDEPELFALEVIKIYNNEKLLEKNAAKYLEYIRMHFSDEVAKKLFKKVFS